MDEDESDYEVEGSSPRTRGTEVKCLLQLVVNGIIPAYAGNSGQLAVDVEGHRDHPRVRGEQLYAFLYHDGMLGSSPRTRGTV